MINKPGDRHSFFWTDNALTYLLHISINREKLFAILESITVLFNEANHKEQTILHDLYHPVSLLSKKW